MLGERVARQVEAQHLAFHGQLFFFSEWCHLWQVRCGARFFLLVERVEQALLPAATIGRGGGA